MAKQPAYMTKPFADLTEAELREFENDSYEAAVDADESRGAEFPCGEFAPQANVGPLW